MPKYGDMAQQEEKMTLLEKILKTKSLREMGEVIEEELGDDYTSAELAAATGMSNEEAGTIMIIIGVDALGGIIDNSPPWDTH
jgi:hypothetical protein